MNEVYVQEELSGEVKILEVSSCSDTNPVTERVYLCVRSDRLTGYEVNSLLTE